MTKQLLQYLAGITLFVVVCNAIGIDMPLALMSIRESVMTITNSIPIPQLSFNIDHITKKNHS